MGSIVITMLNPQNAVRVKEILQSSGLWENIIISRHGAETLSLVDNQDISLVICTKKLSDMGYEELTSFLPARINIVLFTKDAALVPFAPNVVKILMPFKAEDLIGTVKSLIPTEHKAVKKKRIRTFEEQQIIDEAKKLIMDRNDMTEPEAFRYIQKISMDERHTFVETAQMILDNNGV